MPVLSPFTARWRNEVARRLNNASPNVEEWRGYNGDPSDTSAFQNAMDASAGRALLVSDRTYDIESRLNVTVDGLWIKGTGPRSSILKPSWTVSTSDADSNSVIYCDKSRITTGLIIDSIGIDGSGISWPLWLQNPSTLAEITDPATDYTIDARLDALPHTGNTNTTASSTAVTITGENLADATHTQAASDGELWIRIYEADGTTVSHESFVSAIANNGADTDLTLVDAAPSTLASVNSALGRSNLVYDAGDFNPPLFNTAASSIFDLNRRNKIGANGFAAQAIQISNTRGAIIRNCRFVDFEATVIGTMQNASSGDVQDILIKNNVFERCGHRDSTNQTIELWGATARNFDCVVDDNEFIDCYRGNISVRSVGARISRNRMKGAWEAALGGQFNGDATAFGAIADVDCRPVLIEKNIIDTVYTGDVDGTGMFIGGQHPNNRYITISGNHLHNVSEHPIQLEGVNASNVSGNLITHATSHIGRPNEGTTFPYAPFSEAFLFRRIPIAGQEKSTVTPNTSAVVLRASTADGSCSDVTIQGNKVQTPVEGTSAFVSFNATSTPSVAGTNLRVVDNDLSGASGMELMQSLPSAVSFDGSTFEVIGLNGDKTRERGVNYYAATVELADDTMELVFDLDADGISQTAGTQVAGWLSFWGLFAERYLGAVRVGVGGGAVATAVDAISAECVTSASPAVTDITDTNIGAIINSSQVYLVNRLGATRKIRAEFRYGQRVPA